MTDYAPSGMIRPDDTAQIKDLGKFIRQHANSSLPGVAMLSATIAAGSSVIVPVTFPAGHFIEPPFLLLATIASGSGSTQNLVAHRSYANSAGDGHVIVRNMHTASVTVSGAAIAWLAIGRGPETGG